MSCPHRGARRGPHRPSRGRSGRPPDRRTPEVVAVAARDPRAGRRRSPQSTACPASPRATRRCSRTPTSTPSTTRFPTGCTPNGPSHALEAGKHVLCEKPFTANAAEARAWPSRGRAGRAWWSWRRSTTATTPAPSGSSRSSRAASSGALRRIETADVLPAARFSDIRYRLDLAGGATMDAGCYAVHMARLLGGEEPQVTRASAKLQSDQVDRSMTAELRFPSWPHRPDHRLVVVVVSDPHNGEGLGRSGPPGHVQPPDPPPLAPAVGRRPTVGRRIEQFPRRRTYDYQLEAFCAAVLRGEPILTPPADSVANMRVIDETYRAAGLRPRGSA